jgi:hypothetical protein
MQRKTSSLPFKWYFLSFVGALLMALMLMTAFEIRILNLPDPKNEVSQRAPRTKQQALASQPQAEKQEPPKQKDEEKKPKQPKRNQGGLWDLIVTPYVVDMASMIVGGTALVGLGTVATRWSRGRR